MIFVAILLLIAGFVALVKGADVFVDGAGGARREIWYSAACDWTDDCGDGYVAAGGGSQHHCGNKG